MKAAVEEVFRRYAYSLVYRTSGDLVRVLTVAHDQRRAIDIFLSNRRTVLMLTGARNATVNELVRRRSAALK